MANRIIITVFTLIVFGALSVWLLLPAKPLRPCEDFLSSSIDECNFTKGSTR